MKIFGKLIITLISVVAFLGCDDFLTMTPESTYTVDIAYKTQTDFEFAIAGVYATQQDLYQAHFSWFFRIGMYRGDETRAAGKSAGEKIDIFADDANTGILERSWPKFWTIISRCNLILDKIDAVEFKDNNVKNYIQGEAHALRAWAYYNLAWQYGGVPLIETEMTVEETKTIPRSSQEETFDFAISDYTKAIDLLPEDWAGIHVGRVTKYAAMGGLARVYMFRSDFDSAAPLLKNIIDSDKYAMEEDYINSFTDSHDNGKERVWEVQFNDDDAFFGEGQWFSTGMLPGGYRDKVIQPFGGYSSAYHVSLNMMDAYEEGDIRKEISTVSNLRVGGVIEEKYAYILKYSHYDDHKPSHMHDWANNAPILRYTDVKMMYAEAINEAAYSPAGDAFSILNEVRRRAGLSEYTSSDLPDQSSFREAIRKERRVEFAFEGLRWIDLIRWGIVVEVMNEHLMHEDEGGGRYSMKDYQKIFAIPFSEISRYNDESVMWQNPGY